MPSIIALLLQESLHDDNVTSVLINGVERIMVPEDGSREALLCISDGSQDGGCAELVKYVQYGELVRNDDGLRHASFTVAEANKLLAAASPY